MIDRAAELPAVFRAAFRAMTSGRPGAAHIGLPFDVQRDAVDEVDVRGDPALGAFPARRIGPDPDQVAAAAEALASAREPLVICGGGPVIAGAEAELVAIAELLEAPVATTVSGQGAIADDHPLAVGVIGSNGGVIETVSRWISASTPATGSSVRRALARAACATCSAPRATSSI